VLFNSFEFAFFLPLVVAVFFLLPQRARQWFLLGASYYFYMCWRVDYIVLILASTLVAYVSGLRIARAQSSFDRKLWLVVSLVGNLGLLFAFKYINLAGESVESVFSWVDISVAVPWFDVLLPVGISFYTFQTLSYTIDVYQGEKSAEGDFPLLALYVAFFPQLVAGPIERATRLLPQLERRSRFEYGQVRDGIILIFWGLFKKVVIADRLAILVDEVYSQPGAYEGFPLWVATYAFAFQIYCDFSGYSDIAIGSAQIMGYKLMTNFRRPYYAAGFADFWKRWHISLSTWFRDYLYIPLGGNRVAAWRVYLNVFVVFLLSGLWHGANWTFLIWGGLHGIYLMGEKFFQDRRPAWNRCGAAGALMHAGKVFLVFHLVCLAWIFFRANSVGEAFQIAGALPNLSLEQLSIVRNLGLSGVELLIAFGAIVLLEAVHWIQCRKPFRQCLATQPIPIRWSVYVGLVLIILFFGEFGDNQQFIYFQF